MKPGPKTLPAVLKQLHGNPGKRRLNDADEPQGVGELWAPPPHFDDELRDQWHYALDHAPPGLLTGTDRGMLIVWVAACVEHARALVEVRRHGQVVKTKDGNAIQNPYLGVMNRQALMMIRAAAELGFSPAARATLGSRAPEFPNGQLASPVRSHSRLAAYLDRKPDKLDPVH